MGLFLTSIPKSGTHLLVPVLEAALGERARVIAKRVAHGPRAAAFFARHPFVYGHIRCRVRVTVPPDVCVLALIRDPRDVLLSMRDYLFRSPNPRYRAMRRLLGRLSLEDQLIRLADGVRAGLFAVAPIEAHCGHMLEWRKRGGAIVRYEELLEPAGADALAAALGRPDLRDALAAALAAELQARSGTTFNVGGTRWRREMPQAVLEHLRRRSAIVARLGYGS